jgi:hypothetical protein
MLEPTLIIALASLMGLALVVTGLLKAWQGWLNLKNRELTEQFQADQPRSGFPDEGAPMGAARIEISDLKERIKKLEAIASGVDL